MIRGSFKIFIVGHCFTGLFKGGKRISRLIFLSGTFSLYNIVADSITAFLKLLVSGSLHRCPFLCSAIECEGIIPEYSRIAGIRSGGGLFISETLLILCTVSILAAVLLCKAFICSLSCQKSFLLLRSKLSIVIF